MSWNRNKARGRIANAGIIRGYRLREESNSKKMTRLPCRCGGDGMQWRASKKEMECSGVRARGSEGRLQRRTPQKKEEEAKKGGDFTPSRNLLEQRAKVAVDKLERGLVF